MESERTWQPNGEMREDPPDHVIAFTHNEVLDALVARYNDRFPVMSRVDTWRMRYDLDVAVLKLWDTP